MNRPAKDDFRRLEATDRPSPGVNAKRPTRSAPDREPGRVRAFFERWLAPYLPYPHLMWLAPLDVVLPMLLRPPAPVPPAYWPRLAVLLLTSTLSTIGTLPERLIAALWLRLRPPSLEGDHAPIFVLGYFRSGTTFLQTLLAADPMLRSPRWVEVLVPQTHFVGWTFFRYLMAPFVPLARLEAISPMGPTLPAEDDFALANWGRASIMAGRAVLPRQQDFYDRFHDLEALTPGERSRWRTYQRAFVAKLAAISGGRRIVLKSPSHTARVRHLLELFPGAKFIHISRPPDSVLQSNILLVKTMQRAFALQHPLPDGEQERRIAAEYLSTERHYLADRASIPAGDLAEVRLQDLAADPVGELKRVYGELGLPFTAAYAERLPAVLAVEGNRSANRHAEPTAAQKALVADLAPLIAAFGHDRPARPL